METNSNELLKVQVLRWWFPLVVTSVIVLGLFVIIIPKSQHVLTLRDELAGNQELLTKLEKKAAGLQSVPISQLDQYYSLAEAAIPSNKPYFEVLGQLQVIASKTGVILGDYDLKPGSLATESAADAKTDEQVALDTELSVKGTDAQINAFLDEINAALPLFTISDVSLEIGKENVVTANMGIQIYYQQLPTTKGKLETSLPKLDPNHDGLFATIASYQTAVQDASGSGSFVDLNRQDIFTF